MKFSRFLRGVFWLALASLPLDVPDSLADSPAGLNITGFHVDANAPVIDFDPLPSAVEYQVFQGPDLTQPFQSVPGGTVFDFQWRGPVIAAEQGFYRMGVRTLTPDELTAANLLNRVAYGPTPDEMERVRTLGVAPYLERQLNSEQIVEDLDTPPVFTPQWRKVTVSGPGSASTLYIYLDDAGEVYLDDLRLVAGATDDGTQPNLLKDGGFETPLGTEWVVSPNLIGSALSAGSVHAGATSLHVLSTDAGTTKESSIYQAITPALSTSKTYTLSYWYLTADQGAHLTVRLSGSGIVGTVPISDARPHPGRLVAGLAAATSGLADLRAWHLLRAVQSQRQLNEILRQFCENHFVTQWGKSNDYLDNAGYPGDQSQKIATQMEFFENRRWQAALLEPQVTFHDLLRISAESPAMIIYLDTVGSRGDKNANGTYRVANENYARELCELFCLGVDNGYDQGDIVQMSRVWTGWTADLLAPGDEGNPFARRSTVLKDPNAVTNRTSLTNLVGTWSQRYISTHHDPRAKYLFFEKDAAGNPIPGNPKKVPARFGPPWAGRSYGLALTTLGNTTNTIDQGYAVLSHLADQPFTEEFLVVKLCRLLIHDDFQIGYDFTDASTSPEEELVKAAMLAWENPASGPKGQLRAVLRVILQSDLFRSTLSTQQKVKTPLEFAASTIRALRADKGDGGYTADTDGYSLQAVVSRAGRMQMFDRAAPDGYPETAPGWISSGTLAERLRFVQAALMAPADRPGGELGAATFTDPVALLRIKQPAGMSDPEAVSDYFLGLLFPAEGTANLQGYRGLAVRFLNTGDDGTTASAFSGLAATSKVYDTRVRGLVAFLLTTPRFQEQ